MFQERVLMCLARRSIPTSQLTQRGEFGRWVVVCKVLCRLSDHLWQEGSMGDLLSGVGGCASTQGFVPLSIPQ